jgi:hypothetical protein
MGTADRQKHIERLRAAAEAEGLTVDGRLIEFVVDVVDVVKTLARIIET